MHDRLNWLFPAPRHVTLGNRTIRLSTSALQRCAQACGDKLPVLTVAHTGADEGISATIGLAGDAALSGLPIPEQAEGYYLRVSQDGVIIAGRDVAGCFYGAVTLRQLLEITDGQITCPEVTIVDWPDFRHRGLFVEDFWGTDLMTLDDYRELIDRCAALKLNTLAIGIFGGWEIKHHGERTEFLMAPLERHPELRTPQRVRYFDPESLQWAEMRYLPRMFEEDYLGEVMRLAGEKHIRVIPLWGGPAHVTLLPRTYPAVSAKDAAGHPVHYGYCVSEPATWDLLTDILDELVDRYLLPHGLDMLQLACDEIYPIRSVYPENPLAEANPWCQCPDCATLSQAEQLTKYVVTLASHLKSRGIKTMIWQDTFERLHAMPALWEGLQAAGLQDAIVMGWWCYKEPLPDFSQRLPIPNWVQPSAGILASIFYQDFSRNIHGMLRRGQEIGADGATAYNIPDPAQHKNYHCLAQLAWNGAGVDGIPGFEVRYAHAFYGHAWRDALEAYDAAQRVFGSYPLMVYILDQLLYYFNSYPYGVKEYPANVLAAIAADPLALQTALKQSIALLETAKGLIERCRAADSAGLVPMFVLECDRVISVARGALETVAALSDYMEARRLWSEDATRAWTVAEASVARLEAARDEALRVMREIKSVKPAYLIPSAWREVSYLVSFMHDLAGDMRRIVHAPRRDDQEPPPLAIVDKIGERALRTMWHPWEF